MDLKEDRCKFGQNGSCLFYDIIDSRIGEIVDMLENVIPFTGQIQEIILAVEELGERGN